MDYKKMSPEEYRSLRANGQLPHQQATTRTNASAVAQRDAIIAARQAQQQQQVHERNVRQVAESQLDTIRASQSRTPESILRMQIQHRDYLLRTGKTDRARAYDALIAKQQSELAAQNARQEYEQSDEYITTRQTVDAVRPLVAQYTPDALVMHDAAVEVFRQTHDQDQLFSTIAKISNAAVLAERMVRHHQAAKLTEQQTLLSQASAEQLAASKVNDAMIAAAAQLNKAAE